MKIIVKNEEKNFFFFFDAGKDLLRLLVFGVTFMWILTGSYRIYSEKEFSSLIFRNFGFCRKKNRIKQSKRRYISRFLKKKKIIVV